MHKSLLLTLLLICAGPSLTVAQGQGGGDEGGEPSCGTVSNASDHLTAHKDLFQTQRFTSWRDKYGISALDSSDIVALVQDTSLCGELVGNAEEVLGAPLSESMYAVYHYGDYYVVEVRHGADMSWGALVSGHTDELLVYNGKNNKYITLVLR